MSYINNNTQTEKELVHELKQIMSIDDLRDDLRQMFSGYLASKIFTELHEDDRSGHAFTYFVLDDFFNHLENLNK